MEAYESAGLEVNVGKMKVLAQSHPAHPLQPFDINIHGNSVEQVARFCYLGSMINNTNDPNEDIITGFALPTKPLASSTTVSSHNMVCPHRPRSMCIELL